MSKLLTRIRNRLTPMPGPPKDAPKRSIPAAIEAGEEFFWAHFQHPQGGVHHHLGDEKLMSEATAFAIDMDLQAYRRIKDKSRLNRALKNMKWLQSIRENDRYYFGYNLRERQPIRKTYVFDNSVIIYALAQLQKETGKDYELPAVGLWLLSMQNENGSYETCLHAPNPKEWYEYPNVAQMKIACALLALNDLTKDPRYTASLKKLHGFINTLPYPGFPHPYCYQIEGLLHMNAKEEAHRHASFLSTVSFDATYAVAQAIRIWTILGMNNLSEKRISFIQAAQTKEGYFADYTHKYASSWNQQYCIDALTRISTPEPYELW